MSNLLKVTSIRHDISHNTQSLTASFASPKSPTEVWFRADAGEINTSADAFVPVALIPAMRRHWKVSIDGEVSPRLLQGTNEIQHVMRGWYPKFRQVKLTTAGGRHATSEAKARPMAAFFSGGVDSFFTLLQHQTELTHLIFVHGFDLPLEEVERRRQMADNARQVSSALGLKLVEVETNLRAFGDSHVNWPAAYFGAGLAAVGLLLSPRFAQIYIPASVSDDQLIPMGSHPDLDHHWSNTEMELVHDGAAFNRSAKIAAIADMPLMQRHLRVCYQTVETGLNCGRCRKCLWTMLVLESMGCLDSVTTLPDEIDPDTLRRHLPTDKHQQDRFHESIRRLKERNANPELQDLLHDLLREGDREAARSNSRLRRWVEKWFPKNPQMS